MDKENELEYLIAMYGLSYFTLKDIGMLGKHAEPIKLKKSHRTQNSDDQIAIYKWLSEKIRGLSQSQINSKAEKFNKIARTLQDSFFLNNYLMSMFMFQYYLEEIAKPVEKNMMLPKATRLIKNLRLKILETEENGECIILDSSRAASNIWRLFNGKAQLTNEMREARIKMWREAARNKPKALYDMTQEIKE